MPVKPVTYPQMLKQIRAWRVSAVVAVAKPDSGLGLYLKVLMMTAIARPIRCGACAEAGGWVTRGADTRPA